MERTENRLPEAPELVNDDRTGRRRVRRSLFVMAMSAMSIGTLLVSAAFQSSVNVTNNTFSTGSVSLSTDVASALVEFKPGAGGLMVPGNYDFGAIEVTNDGSMQLRYSITSALAGGGTANDDLLAAALRLVVKRGATCTQAGLGAGDGDEDFTDGTGAGTTVYDGPLGGAGTTKILGDPAAGQQAGVAAGQTDPGGADKLLDAAGAGQTDDLCFLVLLPAATSSSTVQDETANITFAFQGEQTT